MSWYVHPSRQLRDDELPPELVVTNRDGSIEQVYVPYDATGEQLEAENTKLRELVEDMYACISHANEQDWFYFERDKFGCGMSCTVNGEACGLRTLADHMRELGIEVSQ